MIHKKIFAAVLAMAIAMSATIFGSASGLSNNTATRARDAKVTVFSIKNNPEQTSVTQSGSFEATTNQTLTINIKSTVLGGTVDLFLFSPSGVQRRITIGNRNETKTIALTKGVWAYNCTGFFTSGNVSIVGDIGVGKASNITEAQLLSQDDIDSEASAMQTEVFTIKNNAGQTSVSQSGSFISDSNQTLFLNINSNVSGGTVDLFLFSPSGNQQRITIGKTVETKKINITKGEWAYNCTGFFTKGNISIVGSIADIGEPMPSDSPKCAFSITNEAGQTSVTQSGSFSASEGQTLTIKIETTISGGTIDLFLFAPNNQQQRITIDDTDDLKVVTLTQGVWAYNCTGFFSAGNISIEGVIS